MPSFRASRQPIPRFQNWFCNGLGRLLLLDMQQHGLFELSHELRCELSHELSLGCNHSRIGLHLRPVEQNGGAVQALDPGVDSWARKLVKVLTLHRTEKEFGQVLAGALRCRDDELPFADKSFSLIYSEFMLETSVSPSAMMREISRTLEPEGVAMIVSLNPFSPSRWHWLGCGMLSLSSDDIARMARTVDMEVVMQGKLGPIWLGTKCGMHRHTITNKWIGKLSMLRAVNFILVRRRDITLTAIRPKAGTALKLRYGLSHG